jgi:DNA-binding transcriptional LysR family regulator
MPLRFDLRHLRYFVTVAEEASFRKAAARLHLSQPPLSRQIRELEKALDASLFSRGTDGVTLTVAGTALLPRALALLAGADALADAVAAAGPAGETRLQLGVTVAFTSEIMAKLERAWQRITPQFDIVPGHSTLLIERLRRDELAFALIGLPGDTAGLHVEVIDIEYLIAAFSSRHPAAKKSTVSLHDFAALPLFWWRRAHNPQYFDHTQEVFRDLGYRPKLIYVESGQYLTLERIGRGEGITLLNARREHIPVAGVTYRPLKEKQRLAIRIAAAWKPGPQDHLAAALAKKSAQVLKAAAKAAPTAPAAKTTKASRAG